MTNDQRLTTKNAQSANNICKCAFFVVPLQVELIIMVVYAFIGDKKYS